MKKQLLALTTAVTTLSNIGFNPSAQANHKAIHQTHEEFYDELDLDISLRYAPSYMQVLFRIHDSTFHPNTSSKNEAEWHAKGEKACRELKQSDNRRALINQQIYKGKMAAKNNEDITPAEGFNNHVAPYLAAASAKCKKFQEFAIDQFARFSYGRVNI
jgi:hypothetical protein